MFKPRFNVKYQIKLEKIVKAMFNTRLIYRSAGKIPN